MKFYKKYLILPILSIIFSMDYCVALTITKGPYLITTSEQSLLIRWETDSAVSGTVRYGRDNQLAESCKSKMRGEKNNYYLHEAQLKNLLPSTKYYYQIKIGNVTSNVSYFYTAFANASKLNFVAMGDSRSNPGVFEIIVEQVKKINPDLVISMGDLVEDGGNFEQWNEHYFQVTSDLLNHIPLSSTLGDHEGDGDNGALMNHYLRVNNKVDEQWFSFDYGPAHFVSLDYRHPDNKNMIKWFKQDMDKNTKKWTFVYTHRPSYNLGGHRSDWGINIWPELFRKFKVDIVFAGHSHIYERFYPVAPLNKPDKWPVTYITTGGAGAGLYEVMQHPKFLAKAESVNHFALIKISGDTLRFCTYLQDNSIIDNFEIIKEADSYNTEYLALVKPQDQLEQLSMFANAVSFSLNKIPNIDSPVTHIVMLKSYLE
ncbi:MAG TPA: metallophosphoesterase, partial [bacterium]